MWNLGDLEELGIERAPIEELPKDIERLGSLREIWIDECGLTKLPSEIAKLGLTTLVLSSCELTSVPAELTKMKKLRKLVAKVLEAIFG